MKKRLIPILSIGLILILALSATACMEEYIVSDLIAGGGNDASEIDVGEVIIYDHVNLTEDYLVIGAVMGNWVVDEWVETDWEILDAHAHVALVSDDIPQKKGNPIPGKFDLKYDDGEWEDGMAGGWQIELTPAMIAAGTLYIAVHLEVVNDQGTPEIEDDVYESVWADGTDFAGKNWATYFTYLIGTNPEPNNS